MRNALFYKIFLLCGFTLEILGGNPPHQFVSNDDPFGTRVFIENKGQFNTSINSNQEVLYAFENGYSSPLRRSAI